MVKVLFLFILLFFMIMVVYLSLSITHLVADQRTLPFLTRYAQWMPGNYNTNNYDYCGPIYNGPIYYACQISYPEYGYVFTKVDQSTGKILETTFSLSLGTLSQFLYVYGEPLHIHHDGKWKVYRWEHLEIHIYGDPHPDSLITVASYF